MRRDINGYIAFLNINDWSTFHRSQPATRSDPFRPGSTSSGDIADILSEEELDAEMSGLDVYDPAFEQEFNELSDDSLSNEEDFGFTADWQTTDATASGTASKSELLNLIKERELTK